MSLTAVEKPRRRPGERREEVLEGTVQVLIEYGLDGLTHRRVAKAAGVPLSATTLYYATREDLLEAAFVKVISRAFDEFKTLMEALSEDADDDIVISWLARYLAGYVGRQDELILVNEFWVAAWRRETLRVRATEYFAAWDELLLKRFSDPLGARVLTTMLGGLAHQILFAPSPPSAVELEDQLRRAYAGG